MKIYVKLAWKALQEIMRMHSVGELLQDLPVKSCSTVQVLPYNFESRDRGTKLRVTVLTVLVCFFQIKPPHRFHLLFLQDECLDIDRLLIDIDKGNFVVPEDFSVKFFLQNFRECIPANARSSGLAWMPSSSASSRRPDASGSSPA